MTSANEINGVMRRTQRYWYEDGFFDVGFGALLLVLGLLFVAQELTPPESPLHLVWSLAGPIVLIGGGFIMSKGIHLLKERITYPRTGYVSYEQAHGLPKVVRLLTVMLVSAGISVAIVIVQRNWLSLIVILGFVYAAAFAYIGLRFSLRRYLALSLGSLLLGLALAPLSLATNAAAAVFHIGAGALWLLAGWLTYRRYAANAPLAQEGDVGTPSRE